MMLNIRHVDHDASHTHYWRVPVQRQTELYVRSFSMGDMEDHDKSSRPPRYTETGSSRLILTWANRLIAPFAKKNNRSSISGLTRVDRWDLLRGRSQHNKFPLPVGRGGRLSETLTARPTALRASPLKHSHLIDAIDARISPDGRGFAYSLEPLGRSMRVFLNRPCRARDLHELRSRNMIDLQSFLWLGVRRVCV